MKTSHSDISALILDPSSSKITHLPSTVRVMGIDLGTTNSTVAEVSWTRGQISPPLARCVEIEQSTDTGPYTHVLVPSVVALHGSQVLVGEGAKRLRSDASMRRMKDIFYECKNDIGVRRTYHLAPPGYKNAAEISAQILHFLNTAAEAESDSPISRTVVTVPASFQMAQRQDTKEAALQAGIDLQPGDLLDEPVAAFLDYLITFRADLVKRLGKPQNLVVFDFGGGTCDVAVFRLTPVAENGSMGIAPMSVSRYHRLGGGDIDAAIVHEILIPQLCEQHGIDPNEFDFDQRKRHLEPALLSVAEALKVGLCIQIERMQSFGRYEADKSTITKTNPGAWPCPCPGRPDLVLRSPKLSAESFEKLLEPFLDTDFLFARETEYNLTCSIFAPLQDALDRAGLSAKDVSLCMLVGGSCLIPQVRETVDNFLNKAKLLTYEDRESTQVAVARGAAYHALAQALFGKGLVQPVAHDSISLKVASGQLELIPKGSVLPLPDAEGYADFPQLVVPQSALTGSVPLQVELVAGDEERPVFKATWDIPGPVNRGDPLDLRVRMDENQCLSLELILRHQKQAEPFKLIVENPLTLIVNPHATRQRIDEVEENLRTGKVDARSVPSTLRKLADDYAELNQLDKAIDYQHQALRRSSNPDANLLNALGINYGKKRDWAMQEKYYREAFRATSSWSGPLFNLALSQFNRSDYKAALVTIKEALEVEDHPPYLVLQARILQKLGKEKEAEALCEEALEEFEDVGSLSEWALGWYLTAARMISRTEDVQSAEAERKTRKQSNIRSDDEDGGLHPEIAPTLKKR